MCITGNESCSQSQHDHAGSGQQCSLMNGGLSVVLPVALGEREKKKTSDIFNQVYVK